MEATQVRWDREHLTTWLGTASQDQMVDVFSALLGVFHAADETRRLGDSRIPPSDEVWRESYTAEESAVSNCLAQLRSNQVESLTT